MRQPLLKTTVLLCFLFILTVSVSVTTANAGFFDRIQDIYNTPEKISELEQQYSEAKEALAEQQQKFLEQNEQLRRQNEQLIEQNASLQTELAQIKQERQSFISKLINTVIIITVIMVSYLASIRVWRYLVWRKQRNSSQRGISG